MSVIESLALQVPVITSNLGALPELVLHNINGALVDGHARDYKYQEEFIQSVMDIYYYHCLDFQRDLNYTWKNRALEWEKLINKEI